MYRPTVRYADVYKDYVDDLFCSTTLDRNQIIRLALFTAAFSNEFRTTIEAHLKKDVPIPLPRWQLHNADLWMDRNPKSVIGGKDVNVDSKRKTETKIDDGTIRKPGRQQKEERRQLDPQRRVRTIPITSRTANGGITIRL